MSESCGTCRWADFGDGLEDDGDWKEGFCRRYPPIATKVGEHRLPTIQHDEWCGEYKRNIDLIDEGVASPVDPDGVEYVSPKSMAATPEETGLEPVERRTKER